MTWPGRCFTQSELNGCKEIVPQSQTGRRVCDSPEPQYGGLPCAGEETVTRDCYQCNDQGKILPYVISPRMGANLVRDRIMKSNHAICHVKLKVGTNKRDDYYCY